jgi:hypothetical protein
MALPPRLRAPAALPRHQAGTIRTRRLTNYLTPEELHPSPNCQILAGSDPVITENNGTDNIAIFSVNGDLLFYWDDSSGGHEELVASDVT